MSKWSVPSKKQTFIITNTSFLLIAVAIFIAKPLSIGQVEGEGEPYTIALNETNAPVSLSMEVFESGEATIRYVVFDYASAKRVVGYHTSLDEGGTIANNVNTRITSMESITATFSGSEATLTVGWRAAPTTNSQTMTSTIPILFTDNPYFFQITNTGMSILFLESLVITYSCEPVEVAGGQTYFGMYPQTKVIDESLIAVLSSEARTLPTSENFQSWTDYGYYRSGVVSSYMWYIDLLNEAIQYRGIYFTNYRPFNITNSSGSYQDDNGYYASSIYWFKYEPILWRVLDIQGGEAFLMADTLIDSQDYYYSTANRMIGEATITPNNYEHSHIRAWLNETFYDTAFTSEEQARIQTTNVDNSAASTGYVTNEYACSDTNDKIRLLSFFEGTSVAYNLDTYQERQLSPSDYASSQGAYKSNTTGEWWFRSPDTLGATNVRGVNYNGYFSTQVYYTHKGITPALWLMM